MQEQNYIVLDTHTVELIKTEQYSIVVTGELRDSEGKRWLHVKMVSDSPIGIVDPLSITTIYTYMAGWFKFPFNEKLTSSLIFQYGDEEYRLF